MHLQRAVIKEQGMTFAVVNIKPCILNNCMEANPLCSFIGSIPAVLMAQNSRGIPIYYNRRDIAKYSSRVPLPAILLNEHTTGLLYNDLHAHADPPLISL